MPKVPLVTVVGIDTVPSPEGLGRHTQAQLLERLACERIRRLPGDRVWIALRECDRNLRRIRAAQRRVTGFNDMPVEQVAREWGAGLAKLREHGEWFRMLAPARG